MTHASGFPQDELDTLTDRLVLYRCALKLVETWLSNLDDYYAGFADTNPIEHIKCRLKSIPSIAAKLTSRDLPLTADNATTHLTDIAGARIICCYSRDISDLATVIKDHRSLTVLTEKDYVAQPKSSGYRSYHLVAEVTPGGLFHDQSCPVEIQIRTAAMDFWASLEHRVRYKYGGDIPDPLGGELLAVAQRTHDLDERLYLIHELVDLVNATGGTAEP